MSHPLSLYAKLFGGVYETLNTSDGNEISTLIDSSSYFSQATKALDELMSNKLAGAEKIDYELVNWIDSKVLDSLRIRYGEPINRLCCDGHLVALKWLLSTFTEISIDKFCIVEAAGGGHLHVLKWLVENYSDIDMHYCNDLAFRQAAGHGRLHVLKWLVENSDRTIFKGIAFNEAAAMGQLEVLKWLSEMMGKTSTRCNIPICFNFAAHNGHLDVLKWMVEVAPDKKYLNYTHAFNDSVRNGYLEQAKWLLETFPIDVNECSLNINLEKYPARIEMLNEIRKMIIGDNIL